MAEQVFLYGVYSIHVRPIELQGPKWDAEYEIRHLDHAVKAWTTVGGDDGLFNPADAVKLAHERAVADIEAGAGIPKPRAFP
ncbi:hypothetical protein [Caballeronia sp. RCC_10]|uniref:hypothetical protein n=1 Tax=Caballeronia sp. RCC_10 TaxID=3239227 RepID=UPI003524E1BF